MPSELFDHELVSPSCNDCRLLVLEILSMLALEFFCRLLGEVGGDKGLEQGHDGGIEKAWTAKLD